MSKCNYDRKHDEMDSAVSTLYLLDGTAYLDRSGTMEKFLVAILLSLSFAAHGIESEVADDEGEKNEFWAPDMVPHPHPPWEQPSGPGEPEMA